MAFYDRGTRYDSGARYDSTPPTLKRTRMAQVKLELAQRTDDELKAFAEAHVADMVDNANFPTPTPTVVAFVGVLDDFDAKMLAFDQAQTAAREAAQAKDDARVALSQALNDRGNYVQTASAGDEAKILSAGFGVRSPAQPVGPLPAPLDFMPSMGDMPGEIDLTWSAVRGARAYLIEWREQGTTGAWSQGMATKSRHSVTGLTSGKTYTFRVAGIGAAGQGPWSLEAARMAP